MIQLFTISLGMALTLLPMCAAAAGNSAPADNQGSKSSISTGELWLDQQGKHINAHGGGVVAYRGTYYWYGEHKADTTSRAMVGVTCYSSQDLRSWQNRGTALRVTDIAGHDIERGCILERPKVVYCERTGKFVMWFHLELKGRGYGAARYGVAVSDTPEGPFTYLRSARVCPECAPQNMPLTDKERKRIDAALAKGKELKWWTPEWRGLVKLGLYNVRDRESGQMARDMTVYVDADGTAYHIYSSEENQTLQIAELTPDYLAHTGRYWRMAPGGTNEAPAVFRHDGTYYMITSGCTGWAPNAARLFSAPAITGPWTEHPNPCRGEGADTTFGGQSTYILSTPEADIFMADIWRPKHPSDARYIWTPIEWEDGLPVVRLHK